MMANPSYSTDPGTSNHRPTWAEIDLDALAGNFHIVKDRVGADVKCDVRSEGQRLRHGAVECARA